jgi:hypothetical protein
MEKVTGKTAVAPARRPRRTPLTGLPVLQAVPAGLPARFPSPAPTAPIHRPLIHPGSPADIHARACPPLRRPAHAQPQGPAAAPPLAPQQHGHWGEELRGPLGALQSPVARDQAI